MANHPNRPVDMRHPRDAASVSRTVYNEGLAAGSEGKPSVAPAIYPHLSNDWQLWMGGHAKGIQTLNRITQLEAALALAKEALEHSVPKAPHYPEPNERHAAALAAVTAAESP